MYIFYKYYSKQEAQIEVNICNRVLFRRKQTRVFPRYPDNSPLGQFSPDNSPPIFKQLVLRSFIHKRAKWVAKYINHDLTSFKLFFIPPGLMNKVHSIYISAPWFRFTLMDLTLRALFHQFQKIFDWIWLTFSAATGTKSINAIKCFHS